MQVVTQVAGDPNRFAGAAIRAGDPNALVDRPGHGVAALDVSGDRAVRRGARACWRDGVGAAAGSGQRDADGQHAAEYDEAHESLYVVWECLDGVRLGLRHSEPRADIL